MRLNTIKPNKGARQSKHRVGRGIGCGSGKTCGRGHKGQTSRTGGGKVPAGFEGGQMPLVRRVPKFGFISQKALTRAEVRLHELNKLEGIADLQALKAANIVSNSVKTVKIIANGKIEKALTVRGLGVTRGAKVAIEKAGGSVES